MRNMTKQICIRCGKSYTDLRVFIISPGPGLCPDCQREAGKSVINKLFGSKWWIVYCEFI